MDKSRVVKKAVLATLAGLALLTSGCSLREWVHNGFKVGPNYSQPAAAVASEWIDYRDPRVKSEEQDFSEWWRVFDDPALDSLMETAYQQNLSLRAAGARILAARAQRGIAVGSIFPQQQQVNASRTNFKLPTTADQPFVTPWFGDWTGGFSAAWELDFWGLYRRAVEAASAELDASIDNYDDVLVVLLADIATNYVQYRTYEQRLVYARQNVEIQTKSYELAQDKFKAGKTTERDVHQAKQILEQTRASIPQLETGLRQANNNLCLLLGIPPERLAEQVGGDKPIPTAPPEVAVGIPADLLRRRPDVRRAERQVAAQSARIGVAKANFYPHFSLVGTVGLSAVEFSDLWKTPKSMYGAVGPSMQWNILNYGRILNDVRLQDAHFQELAFAYQNTVLQAGREAENAVIAFLNAQEQTNHLAASVDEAARTLEITYDQYKLGAVDFTPVFLFQSTLAQQQDQLAFARGSIALNLIALYRSLGGGWEMRLAREGHGCVPVALETTVAPAPEKSEVGDRRSEVGSQRSEGGSPKSRKDPPSPSASEVLTPTPQVQRPTLDFRLISGL